jgi:5-methylcytosine-specific restriction protein B
MKYVSKEQVSQALPLIASFRSAIDKQAAQHILTFLALKCRDVGTKFVPYAEGDDYKFFDEFMKLRDGEDPYFDPVASLWRIASHPHSNVATARKNTFFRRWGAAEQRTSAKGIEEWRLTDDYLDIFKARVLTKAGHFTPIPVIPLAVFFLRGMELPEDASLDILASRFALTFHLTSKEYAQLFERDTRPEAPFADRPITREECTQAIVESGVVAETRETRSSFQELAIPGEDPILRRVRQLLDEDGYGGVIFVGPPGTSKSWYAAQIALALADGDATRVRKIQFHPSFQYEQFVEGFVPNTAGTGFELHPQLMLRVIDDAEANRAATFVVLIDELSRSDPGRVFGELLTYMEPTRRDEPFLLASGREKSVPPNVVFIATMNSRDKSVTEIDDAFDRRMAKIDFPPSQRILDQFLEENKIPDAFRRRISAFFEWVQAKYPLGHTFFRTVKDEESLRRLWETQLRFTFEKQFKYEPATLAEIRARFVEITGVAVS